jgi:effector-binding domain-containing protein
MKLSEPQIVDLQQQHILQIRKVIPMQELMAFYDDALTRLGAFGPAQGIEFTGPPLGITRGGMPTDTIDISAAMPVHSPQEGADDITAAVLPGGRAATLTLTGPYDKLPDAYRALHAWMSSEGLEPGETAWEQYLSMPEVGGDPEQNVTQLWWQLA